MQKNFSLVVSCVITWSVYGVVALVPLIAFSGVAEPFEFPKQLLFFGLSAAAFLAWSVQAIFLNAKLSLKKTPLDIPALTFFGAALLSALLADDRWSALVGTYGRWSDGLLSVASGVMLYAVISRALDQEKIERAIKVLLASSLAALAFWFLNVFGLWKGATVGVAADANAAAVFFATAGVFLIALWREGFSAVAKSASPSGRASAGGSRALEFLERVAKRVGLTNAAFGLFLLGILSLLFFVGFFGAWVAFLAGVFVLSLFELWRDRKKMAVVAVGAVLIFSIVLTARVSNSLPKDTLLSQGLSWQIARDGLTHSLKNFLMGSGPGTFPANATRSLTDLAGAQMRYDRAGSAFAETVATAGILGIAAYLLLLGAACVLFAKSLSRGSRRSVGVFAALVSVVVARFAYPEFTALTLLFWIFLALLVVFSMPSEKRAGTDVVSLKGKSVDIAKIGAGALGAILILVAWFAARGFIADARFVKTYGAVSLTLDERIQRGEEAVDLNPRQAQYKIALAGMYLERISKEGQKMRSDQNAAFLSDDIQRALAYARGGTIDGKLVAGAVELSPSRFDAWHMLGKLYQLISFAPGAMDWGVKAFTREIELTPRNSVAYTELGNLYLLKGDMAKAEENFDKALKESPRSRDALLQKALLEEKKGNGNVATSRARELADMYPKDPDVLFQLGRLLYNGGEKKNAEQTLLNVVEIAPTHSNARYALGSIYEQEGERAKALEQYRVVLQLNPDAKEVAEKIRELE